MTKTEIYNKIVETLNDLFEIPSDKITMESRLYEDLDIDSIDAVDLIVKMRQATGKRLEPEMFKTVRTVEDVVNALDAA
ncbi:MAG: acyl carrier protein [Formosimonas sp.]|jgi:acyl carrier protein